METCIRNSLRANTLTDANADANGNANANAKQNKELPTLPLPGNTHSIYISCKLRNDGICAQMLANIHLMVFSSVFEFEFIYNSPKTVAHFNKKDISSKYQAKDWMNKWEDIFNFNKLSTTRRQQRKKNLISKYKNFKNSNSSIPFLKTEKLIPNTQYAFRDCLDFIEEYRDSISKEYESINQEVKKLYTNTQTVDLFKANDVAVPKIVHVAVHGIVHVAVHVRRNDIVNIDYKFLPNQYFINIMKLIDQPAKFKYHIFTDGTAKECQDFIDEFGSRVEIHSKETVSAQDTLHHLIRADILIMSKSKFSFYAGLISDGIVIYTPFFVSCPKHLEDKWIILDEKKLL